MQSKCTPARKIPAFPRAFGDAGLNRTADQSPTLQTLAFPLGYRVTGLRIKNRAALGKPQPARRENT